LIGPLDLDPDPLAVVFEEQVEFGPGVGTPEPRRPGLRPSDELLSREMPVLWCKAKQLGANPGPLAESILGDVTALGSATDLATEFAARFAMEMLVRTLDLPAADLPQVAERYWRFSEGSIGSPARSRPARRRCMNSCRTSHR